MDEAARWVARSDGWGKWCDWHTHNFFFVIGIATILILFFLSEFSIVKNNSEENGKQKKKN